LIIKNYRIDLFSNLFSTSFQWIIILRIPYSLENELVIKYSARENKPIGKGKVTVEKKETIPFKTIKESKIKLKF